MEQIKNLVEKLEKQMDHFSSSVKKYAEKHEVEVLLKQVQRDQKTIKKITKLTD